MITKLRRLTDLETAEIYGGVLFKGPRPVAPHASAGPARPGGGPGSGAVGNIGFQAFTQGLHHFAKGVSQNPAAFAQAGATTVCALNTPGGVGSAASRFVRQMMKK